MWTSSNTSVNQQFSTNDAGNQPTVMENGGLSLPSSSSAKSYFSSGLLNPHQDAATNLPLDSAGDYYNACQINSNSGEGRGDALNGQIGYYYNHQNQTSQTAQQYFFNGGLNFDYNSFIAEPSDQSSYDHQVTTASNSGSSGCGNSSRSTVAMTTAASLRHLYQTEAGNELEQGQMASTNDQRHQYDSSPSSSTPLALNHVHQLYYSANSSAHFCSNYHLYSQMSLNPNTNLSSKASSDDVDQASQLCSSKMKEIANRLTLSSSSSNDATALSINPSFIQATSYSAEPSIPLLGSSSQEEPGSYTSDVATPSKSAQNSSNSNEGSHKKSYSGKPD